MHFKNFYILHWHLVCRYSTVKLSPKNNLAINIK